MQNTSTSSISINQLTLHKERLRAKSRGDKVRRHMKHFYAKEMAREDAKASKYLNKVANSAVF